MGSKWDSKRMVVGLVVFGLLFFPIFRAKADAAVCRDVKVRGHISVLTINLLFSEINERNLRLGRIADFVAHEASDEASPVDVILLQEVVGGSLSKTANSSLDLQKLLAGLGLSYNLRYTMANGIPGLLTVGNSILSRCGIDFILTKTLPFESEEVFAGLQIPLKRKAIMARIDVPEFGKINVYDTHLCSGCSGSERLQQAQVLVRFIQNAESLIPGKNPIILGGDFNTDLNIPDNIAVYNLITSKGFVDSYASFNTCDGCCTPYSNPPVLSGCTFAVPENPFAFDPFTRQREEPPQRIDYIFSKGFGDIIGSEVVFKGEMLDGDPLWVSDHSGVLSRIKLSD